jgi:hypothetical protein
VDGVWITFPPFALFQDKSQKNQIFSSTLVFPQENKRAKILCICRKQTKDPEKSVD